MGVWEMIATERRDLADQLDALTPTQWDTQSLCSAWTVRDVAAHPVVPHVTPIRKFVVAMIAALGNFDRANESVTRGVARRPTAELVEELRSHAEGRFKPPGHGPEAPLTDMLVHGQDIRLPLHLPADRPVEAWVVALDFLVQPRARRGFVAKALPPVHLVATDADWSWGSGWRANCTAAPMTTQPPSP